MTGAKIIDGKAVAGEETNRLATAAAAFANKIGRPPGLAVILVGEDPASAVYVRNKNRMAQRLGYASRQETLPAEADQATVAEKVRSISADETVDGVLVQLPLPDGLDAAAILDLVPPEKDVDGFHPVNAGRLLTGDLDNALTPCTPAGCIILAKHALGSDLSGAHVVVVGRSNIVGKPAAQLFLTENCTVTIAHSRTRNLSEVTRGADILVAAVGRAEMVRGDWLSPGACVIDVGINRVPAPEKGAEKTKLVGDVAFDEAIEIAGAITPVPGGVGPMTIAMLMRNTFIAGCRREGVDANALLQETRRI